MGVSGFILIQILDISSLGKMKAAQELKSLLSAETEEDTKENKETGHEKN